MSNQDPYPQPAQRHQPRLTHFAPNPHDTPLIQQYLHSAYHTHHLAEYHPGSYRLPPFRGHFYVGRDWVEWERFSMRFFATEGGSGGGGDGVLYGVVCFGDACEGPSKSVHGGCIATFFDEATVSAVSYSHQTPPWTKQLTVKYRRPVPLGGTLQFRCWQEEEAGGHIRCTCELLSLTRADGTVGVAESSEGFTLHGSSEAMMVVKEEKGEFQRRMGPTIRKLNEPIPAKL